MCLRQAAFVINKWEIISFRKFFVVMIHRSIVGHPWRLPVSGFVQNQERQVHQEGRPLPLAGALCPHGAAVEFDELLHDREPQAQPSVPAGRRRVFLPEPVEHVRQELGLIPRPLSEGRR